MAKKQQRPTPTNPSAKPNASAEFKKQSASLWFKNTDINPNENILFSFLNFKAQGLVIAILIFILYANSIPNRYAVDDGMVTVGNRFTKEGLKGVKDLLTKDSFIGGMDKNVLPGGRYRPLSLVTFAMEWQFFGENPYVSHFLNVVLYALTCFLLLMLLRKYLFSTAPLVAFVATLIFAVHPIHIEAVANIKGRDEILAMICMFGSLLMFFRYLNEGKEKTLTLFWAQFLFFLALLSKENPITFLAIIPVTLYFFTPMKIKQALKETLPFLITLVIYFLIRVGASGLNTKTLVQDVFQDPYHLVQSAGEKYATIMYVLGRYLAMLFVPYPLSFDYTYNQIPYRTFSDPMVLIWLAVYAGLAGLAVWGWKKKNIFAYCAFFFIASISIVSNIVFNLGGMMGERFLFQASVAFAIALGAGLVGLSRKMNPDQGKMVLTAILVLITTASGAIIIPRNFDWKSNETLYTTDVFTVPNSTRANKCAGEIYLRMAMASQDTVEKRKKLNLAVEYLEKSLKILPQFKEGLLDLGSAYAFLGRLSEADSAWNLCDKYFPDNEFTGFYRTQVLAIEYGKAAYPYYLAKQYDRAMPLFQKAVALNPQYDIGWYHIAQIHGANKDFQSAVQAFEKAVTIKKTEAEYWYHYGGASFMAGDYERSYKAFSEYKKLQATNPKAPNFPEADAGMEAARARMNQK